MLSQLTPVARMTGFLMLMLSEDTSVKYGATFLAAVSSVMRSIPSFSVCAI
jgi:hypothetical protein